MAARRRSRTSQAWVELLADDPEALSALAVMRDRLEGARHLLALRRFRLIELSGLLPDPLAQAELLHRSIQFYNPHKERCRLRAAAADPTPLAAAEHAVLVVERGGERRAAAERWWLHETGEAIEVREGTAWALEFEPRAAVEPALAGLVTLAGRDRGLLCHPRCQEASIAPAGAVPLPWMRRAARGRGAGAA